MELQHNLIGKRGFEYIETATDEGNAAMTRANLKHGFAVCGLRSRPKRVQVLFSTRLPKRYESPPVDCQLQVLDVATAKGRPWPATGPNPTAGSRLDSE
jgi:hypothetical protein